MARQRRKVGAETEATTVAAVDMDSQPLLGAQSGNAANVRAQWIFYAIASGACAAFNGVFAKLTTTELTTSLSDSIAGLLGLKAHERIVEIAIRGMFFALNLTFNGVMWSLFTTALARGTSTTQVSIMNTSTNFILTALMGLFVFGEDLPPLWWVGATLLVVGNVIVGRKDEGNEGGLESAQVPDQGSGSGVAATAKTSASDIGPSSSSS